MDNHRTPHAERLRISAVIACYRDAPAVPIMHERLTAVFHSLGVDYEIIFVNDGSPDNAREVLAELAKDDPHVVVINHTRAFGSQSAFTSGLRLATGDAAVLLDGDLQDPPELIAEFYKRWKEGYDVVYGERVDREAPRVMRFAYKTFYRLFRKLSYVQVPLDAGDFSLLDRRVVDVLNDLPETNRFLRGLRAWAGFKQVGVPYRRPERMFGTTTNSLVRNLGWARRGIISFSYAPLDAIMWFALVIVGVSFIAAIAHPSSHLRPFVCFARDHDAHRARAFHRRHPAAVLEHHRLVYRAHLRGGQAAAFVRRRERAQPARQRR